MPVVLLMPKGKRCLPICLPEPLASPLEAAALGPMHLLLTALTEWPSAAASRAATERVDGVMPRVANRLFRNYPR